MFDLYFTLTINILTMSITVKSILKKYILNMNLLLQLLYYTKDAYACTLNYCCQDVKFDFFFLPNQNKPRGLMDPICALLGKSNHAQLNSIEHRYYF
jgi:hypothetical protein